MVRKGGTIGKRDAVGSWLYKVAYRICLAGRAVAAARMARERTGIDLPARETTDAASASDLRQALDEEVHRLPAKYRAPFVLCCLEGRTNEEAARQLGCPKGTVPWTKPEDLPFVPDQALPKLGGLVPSVKSARRMPFRGSKAAPLPTSAW